MRKILSSVILLFCFFAKISALGSIQRNDNFLEPPYCSVFKKPKIHFRILNGTVVQNHGYPWMVRMSNGCGGTLINSRWILTAGHCYEEKYPKVYLGAIKCEDDDINKTVKCDSDAEIVEIQEMIRHEQYFDNTLSSINDILLAKLKRSVTFNEKIQPICLPYSNEAAVSHIVGQYGIVSGWGSTEDEEYSINLLKTTVKIWSPNKCDGNDKMGEPALISRYHICAGGIKGVDACQGDSGGPMFLRLTSSKNDAWKPYYQVGIISYGKGCGREGYPGVYTNISTYIPWIRAKILAN